MSELEGSVIESLQNEGLLFSEGESISEIKSLEAALSDISRVDNFDVVKSNELIVRIDDVFDKLLYNHHKARTLLIKARVLELIAQDSLKKELDSKRDKSDTGAGSGGSKGSTENEFFLRFAIAGERKVDEFKMVLDYGDVSGYYVKGNSIYYNKDGKEGEENYIYIGGVDDGGRIDLAETIILGRDDLGEVELDYINVDGQKISGWVEKVVDGIKEVSGGEGKNGELSIPGAKYEIESGRDANDFVRVFENGDTTMFYVKENSIYYDSYGDRVEKDFVEIGVVNADGEIDLNETIALDIIDNYGNIEGQFIDGWKASVSGEKGIFGKVVDGVKKVIGVGDGEKDEEEDFSKFANVDSAKENSGIDSNRKTWTLNSAIDAVYSKYGKYSENNNKVFIDELYSDGVLDWKEYEEINGNGFFNFEEDMNYVLDLLEKKKESMQEFRSIDYEIKIENGLENIYYDGYLVGFVENGRIIRYNLDGINYLIASVGSDGKIVVVGDDSTGILKIRERLGDRFGERQINLIKGLSGKSYSNLRIKSGLGNVCDEIKDCEGYTSSDSCIEDNCEFNNCKWDSIDSGGGATSGCIGI